jgi:hypothetical protein
MIVPGGGIPNYSLWRDVEQIWGVFSILNDILSEKSYSSWDLPQSAGQLEYRVINYSLIKCGHLKGS